MRMNGTLVAAAIFAIGAGAHADDYGCQVLLCLSNPKGPTAVQECNPPIQRFLREQAQKPPKPFPQCPETNGQAGLQAGSSPYDPCPDGTTALPAGVVVMQGRPAQQVTDTDVALFTGIGEGNGFMPSTDKKVCVGKSLGTVDIVRTQGTGDAAFSTTQTVEAFDNVTTLDPFQGSPRYVDVFVNGKHYRRVRF